MRYMKNGWNGKCVETVIPNEYKLYLTKNEFYFIARGYHRNSEVNMIYKCEDANNNHIIQDTCKFSIPKDIKSEVQKHIIEQFIMHITNKFPNIHEVIYDEIKKEANQFKECRQYSEKTLIEKFSKIKEQVVKKIITDWKIVNTIVSFYIQTDPIISNYENIKIETTQQELPEILLLHFCKYLRIINLNLEIKQILTYQGVEL